MNGGQHLKEIGIQGNRIDKKMEKIFSYREKREKKFGSSKGVPVCPNLTFNHLGLFLSYPMRNDETLIFFLS